MAKKEELQPRLFPLDTVEHVRNLTTGEQGLRRRKVFAGKTPTEWQRQQAVGEWWTIYAGDFITAAQTWSQQQAAKISESSGINVEYSGIQAHTDEAERKLRLAIMDARGKPIRAFDIIDRVKRQSQLIKNNLIGAASWLNNYYDAVLKIVGEEFNLSPRTMQDLKKFLLQQPLPVN